MPSLSTAWIAAVLVSGAAPASTPGFDRAPFVSPRVVQDLVPWISDLGEQVVAVDLQGAQGSNRYFGEFEVLPRDGESPVIYLDQREKTAPPPEGASRDPFFAYRLVGTTASGVHVLWISFGTGGTGVFDSLLFVRIERERALAYDEAHHVLRRDRERVVLRRLGQLPLGDRYLGKVTVRGDDVLIGRDEREAGDRWWKADTTVHVALGRGP